jgi:hypothetical protein
MFHTCTYRVSNPRAQFVKTDICFFAQSKVSRRPDQYLNIPRKLQNRKLMECRRELPLHMLAPNANDERYAAMDDSHVANALGAALQSLATMINIGRE